jgi:hypothetical protein
MAVSAGSTLHRPSKAVHRQLVSWQWSVAFVYWSYVGIFLVFIRVIWWIVDMVKKGRSTKSHKTKRKPPISIKS